MKDKEITIPADVDSVSLRIERPAMQDHCPTLRELIMSTDCTHVLRIMVKETVRLKDRRVSEFFWTIALPGGADSVDRRKDRVETLACSTLCDAGVLLDERKVTISMGDSQVVFTLEANPDD